TDGSPKSRGEISIQEIYTRIEGLSPQEPYISHLNESALQALNLGGAVNSDELRGNIFPLKDS
ncbi:hypothetical protein CEE35_06980, partial [Candidatus Aerophobetes bacterium Ae_b3b]